MKPEFYSRLYSCHFGETKKEDTTITTLRNLGYNLLNEYLRYNKDVSWGKRK